MPCLGQRFAEGNSKISDSVFSYETAPNPCLSVCEGTSLDPWDPRILDGACRAIFFGPSSGWDLAQIWLGFGSDLEGGGAGGLQIGEPKRAKTSQNEPKRAKTSQNEPKRAKHTLVDFWSIFGSELAAQTNQCLQIAGPFPDQIRTKPTPAKPCTVLRKLEPSPCIWQTREREVSQELTHLPFFGSVGTH